MRVLWFASPCGYQPIAGNAPKGYNGGGWMPSLLHEVKKLEGMDLGVCFAMDGQPFKVEQDHITYYPFPNHKKSWKDKILDIIYSFIALCRTHTSYATKVKIISPTTNFYVKNLSSLPKSLESLCPSRLLHVYPLLA